MSSGGDKGWWWLNRTIDDKIPRNSGWISCHSLSSQIQSLFCSGRLRSTLYDVSFILHVCFCRCFVEEREMKGRWCCKEEDKPNIEGEITVKEGRRRHKMTKLHFWLKLKWYDYPWCMYCVQKICVLLSFMWQDKLVVVLIMVMFEKNNKCT